MPKLKSNLAVFILAAILPALAFAHSVQSGDISVGHIWAYPPAANKGQAGGYGYNGTTRSMPPGIAIDIFGPFVNGGGSADAITGVTSGSIKAANIVMWVRGNQMTRDFPLALPPKQPVALGPQTQFIRLYGVDKSYKEGESFPITFHFQHAPDATIDVVVEGKSK